MRAPRKRMCFLFGVMILCCAGCAGDAPTAVATFNQGAALVGELPMNPLAWRVISSVIEPASGTMSTLYGNDVAVNYIRNNLKHDYPEGSVLSLVTWTQIEDPRWFGAKLPGQVKSVEFVTAGASGNGSSRYTYEAYAGNPLNKSLALPSGAPPERIAYLLSIRAAVMP